MTSSTPDIGRPNDGAPQERVERVAPDPPATASSPTTQHSSSLPETAAPAADDKGAEAATTVPDVVAFRLHRLFSLTAAPVALFLCAAAACLLTTAPSVGAHAAGRVIAGCCTAFTVAMTAMLVGLHLSAFTDPAQQRRIVRILVMAPIYAVVSFIALWHYKAAAVIGLIRDCYESYIIFTFYNLLMGYLGGEEQALALKPDQVGRFRFPLCCLGTFPLTHGTLRVWKALLAQFMIIKPIVSLIAAVFIVNGAVETVPIALRAVEGLSIAFAFTALILFIAEYREALAPYRPVGKFAAIKAILFLTVWQRIVLESLARYGGINGSADGRWTAAEVANGIQNFLICIEMLGMCYLHRHVFSERPYVPVTGHHAIDWRSVAFLCSQSDVVLDVVDVVRPRRRPARPSDDDLELA